MPKIKRDFGVCVSAVNSSEACAGWCCHTCVAFLFPLPPASLETENRGKEARAALNSSALWIMSARKKTQAEVFMI